ALWTTPGHWNFDDRDGMRMVPSFLRAFRTRVGASRRMAERMATHHPAEPHWYLMFLGTRPAVRGKGFGHALLAERLRHCDETGSPAYLESSKPDNVPYYERFGYEVLEQLDVTEGGPPMWSMWRAPRAQSTEP
ncbi:GNAT family N-acetyltransferase, partial [Nocardia gipuzkoensis]